MVVATSLDAPLDLQAPDAAAFLADLQGNISKAHARDHAVHLVIRFGHDADIARAWLGSLARDTMTTAADQMAQIAAFKAPATAGPFIERRRIFLCPAGRLPARSRRVTLGAANSPERICRCRT